MTNEEGTKCQLCIDDDNKYIINDEGICNDDTHYTMKEDGICTECLNEVFNSFCLNDIYGCIYSTYTDCLERNDIFNLGKCINAIKDMN